MFWRLQLFVYLFVNIPGTGKVVWRQRRLARHIGTCTLLSNS